MKNGNTLCGVAEHALESQGAFDGCQHSTVRESIKKQNHLFFIHLRRESGWGVNPLLPQIFVSVRRGWEQVIQFLL